jgi:hypothetical protein
MALHLFRRKKPADSTVGGIAMWLDYITPTQLVDAVNARRTTTSHEQLLGEILIAHGALTRSQLNRVLEIQRGLRGGIENYSGRLVNAVASAHASLECLSAEVGALVTSANDLRVAASKK